MSTKISIAIIGATGRMGSALARNLAKGNYRLILFATDVTRAVALANEIRNETKTADLDCVECAADASWEADIIIPAVPFSGEQMVASRIQEVATQKIVVSISNRLDEGIHPEGQSAAEVLQGLLPYSKVVKAFNTTLASDFASPVIDGKRIDSFIAGDDDEANEIVAALVESAGFNPVVVGRLAQSRTLESMAVLLDHVKTTNQYSRAAGYKILHH